ncbi:MAG TPA: hypothetical protein VM925_06745, partial [Labilithrix sp.]|nr:hypothetical protein [Labilithrix sp.]
MNAIPILRAALVSITFIGLFLVGSHAAAAPMPVARRTGMRGLKRQRALAAGGGWAQLEPVLRWLGARIRRFVGPQLLRSIDRQIGMAGDYLGLFPEELLALSLLGACAGAIAGACADLVVKMGPMLAVAVAAVGGVAPFMTLTSAAADRLKAIGRRLPAAIDLLALSMGAGLD